jgi:hypothetical protein
MASRGAALEEEAAAPEEEEAASYLGLDLETEGGVPLRRRARGAEQQTVCCLGKTKTGARCANPRREVFCKEHAEQWASLTEDFQASLRVLAKGGTALDAAVWDEQHKFVLNFFAYLDGAASVQSFAAAATAGANAVDAARAEYADAVRDGDESLAGASHARHTHARTAAALTLKRTDVRRMLAGNGPVARFNPAAALAGAFGNALAITDGSPGPAAALVVRGSPARGRKALTSPAGRSRSASADTAELFMLRAEVRRMGAEIARLGAALQAADGGSDEALARGLGLPV